MRTRHCSELPQILGIFGCTAYPNTRPFNTTKTLNRSAPHIFIGYPDNTNGYMCYNPISGNILTSHDVIFLEKDFSAITKLSMDNDDGDSTRLNIGSYPIGVNEEVSAGQSIREQSQSTASQTPSFGESDHSSQGNAPTRNEATHHMMTRSQAGIRHPNPKYALQISS